MSVPEATKCSECGCEVDTPPNYCPECGNDEWETETKYDMDDVDFPVIIEYEAYEDTYGMWDRFTEHVFGTRLKESQIANVPDSLPPMKYTVFTTYWKITESERKGPFFSEQEAREA